MSATTLNHSKAARLSRLKYAAALPIFGLATSFSFSAQAEALSVVTSIKPVHSLVSAVMEGVGTPTLLVDGASSPHGFALKPSQAAALQEADAVFWIGEGLAPSLLKPISTLAANAKVVEFMDTDGISHLEFREGASFEEHAHDEEEESHAEHDHGDHAHDENKDHDHGHDDHANEANDPHIWLNPDNAKVMLGAIRATLSELDPQNAARYLENANAMALQIDALSKEIEKDLAGLEGNDFIVFHDAYHHFEGRFEIEAAGAITLSPETAPSAERVMEIRTKIAKSGAKCVFSEPQFEPKIVATVTEGTDTQTAVLDPLGAKLENGPQLYLNLISDLSQNLKSCLTSSS